MKTIVHLVLLALFLPYTEKLFSQYDSLCRSDIIMNLEESKSIKLSDDQNCFIDYTVISDFEKSLAIPSRRINFKVTFSKKLLVIESDILSVYADQSDSYMLMHDQKIITRNDGIKNPPDNENVNKIFSQQLLLINTSQITDCKVIEENNKNYRVTEFLIPADISKSTGIELLKVFYSLDDKRIYKVVMHYIRGNQISIQTIIYNTIDYNYKAKLKGSARERVMESNSKVLSKYKGYTFL